MKEQFMAVLQGYFKCLIDEGEIRPGAFGPQDAEYLAERLERIVENRRHESMLEQHYAETPKS